MLQQEPVTSDAWPPWRFFLPLFFTPCQYTQGCSHEPMSPILNSIRDPGPPDIMALDKSVHSGLPYLGAYSRPNLPPMSDQSMAPNLANSRAASFNRLGPTASPLLMAAGG